MSDFTFIALVIIAYKLVAEPLIDGYKRKAIRQQKNNAIKKDESQQKKNAAPGDYVDYEEVK